MFYDVFERLMGMVKTILRPIIFAYTFIIYTWSDGAINLFRLFCESGNPNNYPILMHVALYCHVGRHVGF